MDPFKVAVDVPQVTGWGWRRERPPGRWDGTETMPLINLIDPELL